MSSSPPSSPTSRSRRASTCPKCGARSLVPVTEDVILRVRGHRYQFQDVPHERCGACGERLFGVDASRQFDARVLRRRRHRAA